jgi:CheY-like chemotaxis protein
MRPKVLILEDDLTILNRHQAALERLGIVCFPTQLARQAIDLMLGDRSIRFALIDVILHEIDESSSRFELDLTSNYLINEPEMQAYTGDGVVREINSHRSDVKYIFITSSPENRSQQSNGQFSAFRKEEERLRRNRGVVDFIHRYQVDGDALRIYEKVAHHIKKTYVSSSTPVSETIKTVRSSRSVGRIEIIPHFSPQTYRITRKEHGTGWLIMPDIVLTCWHLFGSINQREEIQGKYELDLPATVTSSHITFDYLSPGTGSNYSFSELIHYNPRLDYALLRLSDRVDNSQNQRFPLQLETYNPTQEDHGLIIIHHPYNLEQQVSPKGWYVKCSDDLLRILYTVPTEQGSSGAPVIRVDSFKVIAVHTGFDHNYKLQEGVLMGKIMEDLCEYNPRIYDEIINS